MTSALLMHPEDDVAVVTAAVLKGETVTYSRGGVTQSVTAAGDIPVYHKIALWPVKKGDAIKKYGEVIGWATADIKAGCHVHTHNLSDLAEKAGDTP